MIVVDASAALSALLRPGSARAALVDEQLHVPHLIDSEVANGLRRRVAAGKIDAKVAWRVLAIWRRLALTRHPVFGLLPRIWELRDNVWGYDASYIALAESLDCTILTADRRLARAPGPQCSITLVPH